MTDYDVRLKSNGDYWQAWWVARGKRKVRSIGAKSEFSRRQAESICRKMAVDLRLGLKRDGTAPRLSEWIKQYLELRTDLSKDTRTLVEHTGRYLLEYFDQDPTIDKITKPDAAGWRAALARGELRTANIFPKPAKDATAQTRAPSYKAKRKPAKPMSEATVCKHVRTAKRLFEEAGGDEGLELIGSNPFRRLSGKAPKPLKNWATISQDDLKRLLEACPNRAWRCLFALCRLAGLRRQEALDLEWNDVLWGQNKLMVNAHIAKATTKRSPRTPPIEPEKCPTGLAVILREAFTAALDGERLVCSGIVKEATDKMARAIVHRAGIPAYRKPFHALRKNRTGEVAMHYPQHVFTEWFGHDAEVSQDYYLRMSDDLYAFPAEKAQSEAQSGSGSATGRT